MQGNVRPETMERITTPELANAFRVSSIPLVVLMKDGKIAGSSVGYRPKADIEKLLK